MTVTPHLPVRTGLPAPRVAAADLPAQMPPPYHHTEEAEADRAWQALASRLAGVPLMRLRTFDSKLHKFVYPRPNTALSELPPLAPAAVLLYDDALHCWVLAFDFDPGRLGADAVTSDAASAAAFFRQLGAAVVTDVADSGGRHLWVPLKRPATVAEIRELMGLCTRLWPTLDTSASNNATEGCLTPPGSRCKDGRFRRLTITLADAVAAVERRNAPDLFQRALAALQVLVPPPAASELPRARNTDLTVSRHRFFLSPRHQRIAIRGEVPDDTPSRSGPWTRSHACFAVLCGAARRGLQLDEIEQQMDTGCWPGLTDLYIARYGARWRRSLHRDWAKAQVVVAGPDRPLPVSPDPTLETHRTGGTPGTALLSRSATERAFVLAWLHYAEGRVLTTMPGPAGHGALAVIHAVAYLAWRNHSRFVHAGTRSYAHAAAGCMDHTTVAEALQMLRELSESQRLLRRVSNTNGRDADRYELLLPEGSCFSGAVDPTHTLRPIPAVFGVGHPDSPRRRLLGTIGWRLYRALCRGVTGTYAGVAQTAGVGRSSAYRLLPTLADLGLAAQDESGTWRLGSQDPYTAGHPTQNQDHLRQLHARHRADRTAWRARLQEYIDNRPAPMPTPEPPEWMWWPAPTEIEPLEDDEPDADLNWPDTAVALLAEAMGAELDVGEPAAAPADPPVGVWLVREACFRRNAEIRGLRHTQGMSINEIVRHLRVSRKTVRRALGIKPGTRAQ